jgi:hypothetical protein
MTAFCASCAGEIVGGPVLRGGWLYCSIPCAREPGGAQSREARLPLPARAVETHLAHRYIDIGTERPSRVSLL